MAEEKKTTATEVSENQEFIQKLNFIEEMVKKMDGIRKRQFFVTILGILVMLLVMAVFVISLTSFVQNYNAQQLLTEVKNNSHIITEGPELKRMLDNVKKTFLPAYKKELAIAFQAEMPKLQAQLSQTTKELELYLQNDLREKLLSRMEAALKKIEAEAIKKHPELNSVTLHDAFAEVNKHFIENVTEVLNKRIGAAKQHLAMLNQSFKAYKDTPEYKSLKGTDMDVIESNLVETLLELWIYHINPIKGGSPNFSTMPAKGVK
ncbi:MAG: hypothetical protein GY750_20670 [Lentisphaerae bacterium]|nr:hypothetical protein [Lentisphaerota bacterium]MCP4103806.1 hypothetical protein [Lentisphaerota bacterium]